VSPVPISIHLRSEEELIADIANSPEYAHESEWLPIEPWAERIFAILLLCPWEHYHHQHDLVTPIIFDFALEWSSDPFKPPRSESPTTTASEHLNLCDDHDETCTTSVSFDQAETSAFREFVSGLSSGLVKIRQIRKWSSWLNTAMQFMVKSALSAHEAEKFLWAYVALDSLVGRDEEGIGKKIGQRVALLRSANVRGLVSDGGPLLRSGWSSAVGYSDLYRARNRIIHGGGLEDTELARLRGELHQLQCSLREQTLKGKERDRLEKKRHRLYEEFCQRRAEFGKDFDDLSYNAFALTRVTAIGLIDVLAELAPEYAGKAEKKIPGRDTILDAIDKLRDEPKGELTPLARKIREILSKPRGAEITGGKASAGTGSAALRRP
jgi:hypothetical protein